MAQDRNGRPAGRGMVTSRPQAFSRARLTRSARSVARRRPLPLLCFLVLGLLALTFAPPSPAIAQDSTPASTTASAPATPAPPSTTAPALTVNDPAAPAAVAPTEHVADFSPMGLFQQASLVVKLVMGILALASIATWTIWFAKTIELRLAGGRIAQALGQLARARTLDNAAQLLAQDKTVVRTMVTAATQEWQLSADALDDHEGVKERVALHLERIEAASGRRMMTGTGLLATIGSTGPFIGLFGTVWGIMSSFTSIAQSHTTNLAVVAPGIAEALFATAIGLVAAIPAVIIYNHFARRIAAYKAALADAGAAVLRLASRDLSRVAAGALPAARAAE